jgi:hypothetical protein
MGSGISDEDPYENDYDHYFKNPEDLGLTTKKK